MFYRVNEGKLIDCADYKYASDCLETNITTRDYYCENQEKFSINENNELIDIFGTVEYLEIQALKKKKILKKDLLSQIDELDKKRIRAICEPEVKNATTGQTWLEFYTEQIQMFRNQIDDLK
ncbi:MAG: hypothetical protein WCG95_07405 [bacterium]